MKATRALITRPATCRRIGILAFLCAGLSSCATGPAIESQSDPAADFSNYRTYGFLEELAPGEGYVYSTLVASYLKKAAAREMQARGLSPAAKPDLLINFRLVTKEDRAQMAQTSATYYGYRSNYTTWGGLGVDMGHTPAEVSSYTEGTLNVDVIDSSKMQLVWEAIAVGRVKEDALDNPEPAINKVMAQLFEKFPHAVVAPGGSGT